MKTIRAFFILGLLSFSARGELVEKSVTYKQGDTELEGFHVYDDKVEGKRPSVMVVHQWTGISEHEKERSRMLAKLGYNVLAVDIYGKGVRPQPPSSGKTAGIYKEDRELFRQRLIAGLSTLKADERTDTDNIAAIGYCFGGTGVLELARSGADIAGVVSFHGGLDFSEGMTAKKGKIPAKVLVLHGAIDPHVSELSLEGFQKEMEEAGADWQLVSYGGAVHAFTQKGAGNDPSKGAAYHEAADKRSWTAMTAFFDEIFK